MSFTVTFSRVVENGPGMQKIGKIADQGYTDRELKQAQQAFKNKLGKREDHVNLVDLNAVLPVGAPRQVDASVLVVHGACQRIFRVSPTLVRNELIGLKWDRRKLMRGCVKNCQARINLCFSDNAQEPDIVNGLGTVISWDNVPNLKRLRDQLVTYLGVKAENLHAEGNYYHNEQSGIGFHGDAERKIVIAIRFGAPLRLHYQAYLNSDPIGDRLTIDTLQEGDLYVMGDKATGNDWRKKTIITFRHAAERFHGKKAKYCRSLTDIKEARVRKRKRTENKMEANQKTVPLEKKTETAKKLHDGATVIIKGRVGKLCRLATRIKRQQAIYYLEEYPNTVVRRRDVRTALTELPGSAAVDDSFPIDR